MPVNDVPVNQKPTRNFAPSPVKLSVSDEEKRVALKKMRTVAVVLLVVMAVIFVVSYALQNEYPWLKFVRAAAEGGMVGGLADWFAVTALFKHPLGLKIPHTAIIPRRKDAIGTSLSNFVETNFLSEEVVRGKLESFSVSEKVGTWIQEDRNAEKLTDQIADGVQGLMNVLKDDDIQAIIEGLVRKHVVAPSWGPPAGKLFSQVLADGHHHKLIDILVDRTYDWAVANHEFVNRIVGDRSPGWIPGFMDNIVGDKVHNEMVKFLNDVRLNPLHDVRLAIDRYLKDLSQDLQHDPAMIEKVENIKHSVLDDPRVHQLAAGTWETIKNALLDAVRDPESEMRLKLLKTIKEFGERLTNDDEWARKVDRWVADAATNIVKNYRGDIAGVIQETVENWDAQETSRKIELQVGRDLQFIRINGTVVGSLAGLVIAVAAHLVFG